MAGYMKKAASQAKARSIYKSASSKTLKTMSRGKADPYSAIGKMLTKASAKYKGAEGPKKSSPRPGGVGKGGGKGKPANKRKK